MLELRDKQLVLQLDLEEEASGSGYHFAKRAKTHLISYKNVFLDNPLHTNSKAKFNHLKNVSIIGNFHQDKCKLWEKQVVWFGRVEM